MTLQRAKKKIAEVLVSWKFYLLILSTYLFTKGTLSENGWLMMAASTTGLRELVNILAIKAGVSQDAAPQSTQKADNPDGN